MKRPELSLSLLLAGLLSAAIVQADRHDEPQAIPRGNGAEPSTYRQAAPAPGEQTRRLLEQQRAGTHASRHDQWLSGDVQSEIYRRYVESFGHSIPERFIEDDFSD